MTTAIDLYALIDRLKRGGSLAAGELAEVKRRLHAPRVEELAQLARVLSLGAPPTRENVQLLEPWLDLSTDEWPLHGIIVSLCHDWKLTKNYLKSLLSIAKFENWESHESAVTWALSALGDYLSAETDLNVLSHIFEQINEASVSIRGDSSAKIQRFQNSAWYPIDRWQRGAIAIHPRSTFDASSPELKRAVERYRKLLQ